VPDVIDEHFYRSAGEMQEAAIQLDNYDRGGPKIFVGEWATREGEPTTNFNTAPGDAAWMTGMERNSDIILMHCYAPLFVNVGKGAMQWPGSLIGFDALTSYGSPSYYAQKMFSHYSGDKVLTVKGINIPVQNWQPPAPKGKEKSPVRELNPLYYSITRDSKTGCIYLKIVNTAATGQSVHIDVNGVRVAAEGTLVVLASVDPKATNSIDAPTTITPKTSRLDSLGNTFMHTLASYSINVLQLNTTSHQPAVGASATTVGITGN
jgi:alpha-N-arabinofuranosidase